MEESALPRQFEPDDEEEEHDAEFGDVACSRDVGDEAHAVRADGGACRQIAEDGTDPQKAEGCDDDDGGGKKNENNGQV